MNTINKMQCDFAVNDSDSTENQANICRNEVTNMLYECLHPSSTEYNQEGGEFGNYLGPENITADKREKHHFCYPSREDENHYAIRCCKKHFDKPTVLRYSIESVIKLEKKKRFNELGFKLEGEEHIG